MLWEASAPELIIVDAVARYADRKQAGLILWGRAVRSVHSKLQNGRRYRIGCPATLAVYSLKDLNESDEIRAEF